MLAGTSSHNANQEDNKQKTDWAFEVKIFMRFALDKVNFLIFLLLGCKFIDWYETEISYFINFVHYLTQYLF